MEKSPPSARPAFDEASEREEAWRRQQIAALTQTQRRAYDLAQREAQEREKAKAEELAQRRQADIEERMRKDLTRRPELQLNLHGRKVPLTEEAAKKIINDFYNPGQTPHLGLLARKVDAVAQEAARQVDREHEIERRNHSSSERGRLDDLLVRLERGREPRPENRSAFVDAGVRGTAQADFQRAAKEDAVALAVARARARQERGRAGQDFTRAVIAGKASNAFGQAAKDDPISRAVAKARSRQDEQRAHERGKEHER